MASVQLANTIDRLETILQNARSAVGAPKVVTMLNDLLEIQKYLQDHGAKVDHFNEAQRLVKKLKDTLGIVSV